MASTTERAVIERAGDALDYTPAVSTTYHAGTIAAINTATGACVPGATATNLRGAGIVHASITTPASITNERVIVRRGVYRFNNSTAGDLITQADVGADCFIVDNDTVAKTNGTSTRSIAGKVRAVDLVGVWVEF